MLQCKKTQSRQPAWGLAARSGWRAAGLRASASPPADRWGAWALPGCPLGSTCLRPSSPPTGGSRHCPDAACVVIS